MEVRQQSNHQDTVSAGVIATSEDLELIAERERESQSEYKQRIFVCMGTACQSCGSAKILSSLRDAVKEAGLEKTCQVEPGGCQGVCANAPLVSVQPQNVLYKGVTPADSSEVIRGLDSDPVDHLSCDIEAPFFARQ